MLQFLHRPGTTVYRGLRPIPRPPQYRRTGLIISGALHLVLALLFASGLLQKAPSTPAPSYSVRMVPLSELQAAQKQSLPRKQIVDSRLQKESTTPPTDAGLLSDKNLITKKQQIKRGDGLQAGAPGKRVPAVKSPSTKPQPPTKSPPVKPAAKNTAKPLKKSSSIQQAPPPAETTTQSKKVTSIAPSGKKPINLQRPKLRQKLDLGPATGTLDAIGKREALSTPEKRQPKRQLGFSQSEITPFSRASGTNALFHGQFGQNDFLPGVEDGDITLLNAKASKFAVFVRRVALRVFQQIKSDGWQTLSASEIASLNRHARVEAVLTPKGELKSVSLEGNSGSSRFDRMLKNAVSQSARDPHPPPAAVAADGNIRFIFQARSWVQRGGDPRSSRFGERRWLILQTGLK